MQVWFLKKVNLQSYKTYNNNGKMMKMALEAVLY